MHRHRASCVIFGGIARCATVVTGCRNVKRTLQMSRSATVHLYFGEIARLAAQQTELTRVLSGEELARADRFKRDRDRRCYLISRAALRHLLAGYTGRAAAAINFLEGPQGKPSIERGPAFNLSHAGGYFLIGIADSGDLGVDIEAVKRIENLDQLAARCFSTAELAEYATYAGDSRSRAFFRAWTRKEAFIKALGGGLSIPLDSFSVTLAERDGNTLLAIDPQHRRPQTWTILPLALHEALEGAVAWNRPHFDFELQPFRGAVET